MGDNTPVEDYIGGVRRAGEEGEIESRELASGAAIGLVASASGTQSPSTTPACGPSGESRATASLLRARVDALARLTTHEQGKLPAESRGERLFGADGFDRAAKGRSAYERVIPSLVSLSAQIRHKQASGPVAVFAPWSFPGWSPTLKIAPALAAACSILLKPVAETPASSLADADILTKTGSPFGVLNVVTGRAALDSGTPKESPVNRKVPLAGAVKVEHPPAVLSGRDLKQCTMVRGGKVLVMVVGGVDADRTGPWRRSPRFAMSGGFSRYRHGLAAQQCLRSLSRFVAWGGIRDQVRRRTRQRRDQGTPGQRESDRHYV